MGTAGRGKRGSGHPAAGAPRSVAGEAGHAAQADYLAYMVDMIHEMRWLAERSGCQTLAGILELAHREAQLEAARR